MLLALIDYGLIVVFFIGVFGMAIMLANSPGEQQAASTGQASQDMLKSMDKRTRAMSYGVAAALLVLACLLTIYIERTGSTKQK